MKIYKSNNIESFEFAALCIVLPDPRLPELPGLNHVVVELVGEITLQTIRHFIFFFMNKTS